MHANWANKKLLEKQKSAAVEPQHVQITRSVNRPELNNTTGRIVTELGEDDCGRVIFEPSGSKQRWRVKPDRLSPMTSLAINSDAGDRKNCYSVRSKSGRPRTVPWQQKETLSQEEKATGVGYAKQCGLCRSVSAPEELSEDFRDFRASYGHLYKQEKEFIPKSYPALSRYYTKNALYPR